MTLERIVRPFQSRDVTPPTRAIAQPGESAPVENAVLVIGKGGAVKTFRGSNSSSTSRYMHAYHTEFASSPSRKVHTKRITNPDDESQYIEVEVIDEITFRGPNGEVWTLRLNNGPNAVTG